MASEYGVELVVETASGEDAAELDFLNSIASARPNDYSSNGPQPGYQKATAIQVEDSVGATAMLASLRDPSSVRRRSFSRRSGNWRARR
jgi:hypothetical protein